MRTETVEIAVEEVTRKTTHHSMEINNMKDGLQEEVEKIRAEEMCIRDSNNTSQKR